MTAMMLACLLGASIAVAAVLDAPHNWLGLAIVAVAAVIEMGRA